MLGRAVVVAVPPGVPAETGLLGIPPKVMADVQVKVAVAVEVAEGGRGRPVAVPAQPVALGGVLERPVPPVAIQGIAAPSGHEQVGMAVVVDVPHGDAVAVAPGKAGEARGRGGVLEGPVPPVAEQAVPLGAGAVEIGREWPGLRQVDIEPAVSVVVEQSDAAGRGLGHVPGRGHAVIEREAQPGGLGVIQERGRPDGRGGRLGGRGAFAGPWRRDRR